MQDAAVINFISIHSTARVETHCPPRPYQNPYYFNPLHREGGDFNQTVFPHVLQYFNPLHREGGDLYWMSQRLFNFYFNPLHREGGDIIPIADVVKATKISIHSTARVETKDRLSVWQTVFISIHSTARVETGTEDSYKYHVKISIHSTARVETCRGKGIPGFLKFQSTPPRGWRHQIVYEYTYDITFQSTPPRGWRRCLTPERHKQITISIHSTARVETKYHH